MPPSRRPFFPIRSESAPAFACLLVMLAGSLYSGWNMARPGPSAEAIIQGADDTGYYLWLRSWVIDGDVDFRNDLAAIPFLEETARRAWLDLPLTPAGRTPNKYFCGWAVGSLPGFLAAHGLARLLPAVPADGFHPVYQAGVWLNQLLYAALSLVLAAAILRRLLPGANPWLAVTLTWLASPLVYYQSARLGMVHNQVFLLVALTLWLILRWRASVQPGTPPASRPRFWLLALGLASGLLLITRPTAALYLGFPAWFIFREIASASPSRRPALLASLGWAAAGCLPFLGLQMLGWKHLYGSWLLWSYPGEGFAFSQPRLAESLFSDFHGFLNWHPFLASGLAALLLPGWPERGTPRIAFALFLLVAWTNASWSMWYFGSAFGGRAYEGCVLLAMLGTARLLQTGALTRRLSLAAGLLLAAWNLVFLALFLTQAVPREEPVSWPQRLAAVLPANP